MPAGRHRGLGHKPDYQRALQFHSQAVTLAEPLVISKHPAVRVAAKQVMLDAHLGAAHDIAWGTWREKEKAVPVWLDKAQAFADDLIKSEAGGKEFRFRVANRALAACVGLRGKLDPIPWITQAQDAGKELIAATADPVCRSHLQWDLGMALYDAMQVCQARDDGQDALRYGQLAADFLEKGSPQPIPAEMPTSWAASITTSAPSMPWATRIIAWPPGGSTRPCPCWRRRPPNKSPTWAAMANRW